ncbi:hypothetical protein NQ315_016710 [Exocentrus adspersus]|uniref:Uncharacterized protein n=1 Tax=Exocentrus adspersus TaxID=1586481 RepID=A0AAV8VF60_9CUCU|nr:hypothetical protein NQ315_016710 [Exocentrus adspersus]
MEEFIMGYPLQKYLTQDELLVGTEEQNFCNVPTNSTHLNSSERTRYFAQIWNIDYAMGFTLLGMLNGFKNLLVMILNLLAFGVEDDKKLPEAHSKKVQREKMGHVY